MDIQKVKPNDIVSMPDDGAIDITGNIVIPVSWIYYQMKLKNVKPLDVDKLRETLGGSIILDVMINAKRDEKSLSYLKKVDLLIMDTNSGKDRYLCCSGRVKLIVNGKIVNDINFKHKLSDGWYYNDKPNETFIDFDGEFEHEANFNQAILKMLKPYGIKLKKITAIRETSDLFN